MSSAAARRVSRSGHRETDTARRAARSRQKFDQVLVDIADYVESYRIRSEATYRLARCCTLDALACAMQALSYPACTKLLGPVVPGTVVPHGARVPGTAYELDPVTATFNLGCLIRWLDFNDTFVAAEPGHPSDNLAAILMTADYESRRRMACGKPPIVMRDVLTALIKAYEIQGCLSLENSFNGAGYDHMALLKTASAAVVMQLLGGTHEDILNVISNVWADGTPLKAYRQAPNTGSRKSWAAGDATRRAVALALMVLKGEMGYPSVLTAKTYGFYDAAFRGKAFEFQRPYGTYIIEHIVFKFVAAGNLGQTAAECAFRLHPLVKDRLDDIKSIEIKSQKLLMKVMDKRGPLHNPADRDHCAQYVVAVGLLHGKLLASYYEDEFAADPRIDKLRAKINISEEPRYTRDFTAPNKRSVANSIQVLFKDGTRTPKVEIEYAVGHPRRRAEGFPMLERKFRESLDRRFAPRQQARILDLCLDQQRFEHTPVNEFVGAMVAS